MGGLIVIDFIDMNDKHQREVEKRLVDATKCHRARVAISLSLACESSVPTSTRGVNRYLPTLPLREWYVVDLRSLSLSIMRQIEQIALKERQGEVQAEVPTDIAAFLLETSAIAWCILSKTVTRITILPHAHLESPNFKLHFNRRPSSYERITDTQQQESTESGYDVDWQTAENERPDSSQLVNHAKRLKTKRLKTMLQPVRISVRSRLKTRQTIATVTEASSAQTAQDGKAQNVAD